MSLLTSLYKSSLIAQRNNLEYQRIQNSGNMFSLLSNPSFSGDLKSVSAMENSLQLENSLNETELMAINAELNSLNQAKGSKLNYLA